MTGCPQHPSPSLATGPHGGAHHPPSHTGPMPTRTRHPRSDVPALSNDPPAAAR